MQNRAEALQAAQAVLQKATTPHGIMALASDTVTENYSRVWARDSVMAGYAGLLLNDEVIIKGLKASLVTLMQNQSSIGVIPSNVGIKEDKVSYGGSAGRVDSTLWYIVGVLLYVKHTGDRDFLASHLESIDLAIQTTVYWEFNHKHLIYTPLSGNWADEYPIHGYTLYDNCMRLWGLELYEEQVEDKYKEKAGKVRAAIKQNFFLNKESADHYHPTLYARALSQMGKLPYAVAAFNPSRYYHMLDCGGNGLALRLGLYSDAQAEAFAEYLGEIWTELGYALTPAFWPTITKSNELWTDIEMNFAYEFKNEPHHFHNGGIWPIMMGWLAEGLAKYGLHNEVSHMLSTYLSICESEQYNFSEYIASDSFIPAGKSPLCYSAAGLVLLSKAHDLHTVS